MSIGGALGGILGGVAGFFLPGIGGFLPALIGFQLGMAIGSFVDPPKSNEPNSQLQPQDLQFNTFARNLPVPIVYGMNKVAGNVLWYGNTWTETRERAVDAGGGSGLQQSQSIKELWYHADFHVGLSEGTITDVDSIFVDNQDISALQGLNYDIFLGDGTQTADPRMTKAASSAALAMRNTAYLSITGALGQVNRLPIVQSVVTGLDLGGRVNSGGAWTVVFSSGMPWGGSVFNLGSLRDKTGNLYLYDQDPPGKLWRSTDTGSTWMVVNSSLMGVQGPSGITHMAARRTTGALYATGPNSLIFSGGQGNTVTRPVWKSTDGGATWTMLIDIGTLPGLNQLISTNWAVFAPGSLDLYVLTSKRTSFLATDDNDFICYSPDDGVTWMVNTSPDPYGPSGQGASVAIACPEAAPGRVLAATHRGAAYTSYNNGNGWTQKVLPINSGGAGQIPANWGGLKHGFAIGTRRTAAFLNTNATSGAETMLILYTKDAGDTFQTISAAIRTGQSLTWTNENRWFVSNPTSSSVVMTRNGGRAWTLVTSTSPIAGAGIDRGTVVAHTAPRLLYGWKAGDDTTRVSEIPIGGGGCNPAWIIYDLLTNTRYGQGLSEDRIDIASFEDAANYCDTLVVNPDGTSEVRFCLDIVVEQNRPILDVLRDMLATFRGYLVWSQGVVKLKISQADPVTQSFDMGAIVADSFTWKKQSYRERPNVLRIEYINKADDFRWDYVEAFDDWDIDLTGERRERILRLSGIKRPTQASRMAQFYLDQAIHVNHACTFRVGIAALASEVGDVVQVSHDVPAWSNKQFRIMEISEAENDELQLTCIEHIPAVYHDYAVGQGQASLAVTVNPDTVPYQVIRLAPYKKVGEARIEVGYTRAVSSDMFGGALTYLKRGANAWEGMVNLGMQLGPSAYLDSQVFSYKQTAVGTNTTFMDNFNRTDSASVGADWNKVLQTIWAVYSNTLRRGDPSSGGAGSPASDALLATSGHLFGGDTTTAAALWDSTGLGMRPQVGLAIRILSGGPIGQFYYLEYASRTVSHSVLEVSLWRVTSGPVWSQLTYAYVTSGTYKTTPTAAGCFTLDIRSYTITGKLNGATIVSAVDSTIQGSGEAGFARRAGTIAYADIVRADSPLGYWRLGEPNAADFAADWSDGGYTGSYRGGVLQAQTGALHPFGDHDRSFISSGGAAGGGWVIVQNAVFDTIRPGLALEAWVKPYAVINGAGATERTVLARGLDGFGAGYGLRVTSGNCVRFYHATSAAAILTTSGLTINTWHHIVGLWTGSCQNVWIDGTMVASIGATAPMCGNANTNLFVGGGFAEDPSYFWGLGYDEAAVYPFALSSSQIYTHYITGIGSGAALATQGERWDDFSWGGGGGSLSVKYLPNGWSARLFLVNCGTLTSAVETGNTATLSWSTMTASGFLVVYTDGTSYAATAPGARFPSSGTATFLAGDAYSYLRLQGFVTAVQTSMPVYGPKGGFANVGSARIRGEEFGYTTFADSLLSGATRGAGGSTATSHTNVVSLAFVMGSGTTATGSGQFVDLSALATTPDSPATFFGQQSRYLLIGATSKFSQVTLDLATNASQAVSYTLEYSTGAAAWASYVQSGFLPLVDTTSAFQRSGAFQIEPPGDWAPTSTIASGAAIGDATSRYYLRLFQLGAPPPTPPKTLRVLLDGETLVTILPAPSQAIYTPVLADSGQTLQIKAVAVTPTGIGASAAQAPVRALLTGPYLP